MADIGISYHIVATDNTGPKLCVLQVSLKSHLI